MTCVLPEFAAQDLVSAACPDVPWQEALAAALPSTPLRRRVFLNVGANKGYNIAAFVTTWSRQRRVSAREWHRGIMAFAREVGSKTLQHNPMVACGVCFVCQRAPPPDSHHVRVEDIEVHALELLPQNVALLRGVVNRTGLGDLVRVHAVAASNASGVQRFVRTKLATYGRESTMLCGSGAMPCTYRGKVHGTGDRNVWLAAYWLLAC